MLEFKKAKEIADTFNGKYEQLWNENRIGEISELYTQNGILVGYETVVGRNDISKILQSIIDQGWTKIQIETVKVEVLEDVILIANDYKAISKEQEMNAKSSQVLTKIDNQWLTAMHTTT